MVLKVFISLIVSLCLLQGVLGAAVATEACTEPSLGGFILYARIKGSKTTYPVRLVANAGTPTVSHMAVSLDKVRLHSVQKCAESRPGLQKLW